VKASQSDSPASSLKPLIIFSRESFDFIITQQPLCSEEYGRLRKLIIPGFLCEFLIFTDELRDIVQLIGPRVEKYYM